MATCSYTILSVLRNELLAYINGDAYDKDSDAFDMETIQLGNIS